MTTSPLLRLNDPALPCGLGCDARGCGFCLDTTAPALAGLGLVQGGKGRPQLEADAGRLAIRKLADSRLGAAASLRDLDLRKSPIGEV